MMICAAGHSGDSALSTTADAFVVASCARKRSSETNVMSPARRPLDPREPADLHVGVADDPAPDARCEIPDGALHGITC